LGGSNPIGLNEYYRGGSFVPTTGTTTVREPTSGQYWTGLTGPPDYFWRVFIGAGEPAGLVTWSTIVGTPNSSVTSFTSGIYTYFRGTLTFQDTGKIPYDDYGIYRTSSTTTSINTGVPSSGTISIQNLYGAQNP
jgi:hypothetical protein